MLLLVTAACAPTVAPLGPGLQALGRTAPGLTADAVVTEDGLELPLRRWTPQGAASAVVLALHGFNDYSNAFEGPGAYLAAHGLLIYAYDQRGFGQAPNRGVWPGERVLADDLRVAAAALRARHPDLPLFLLGESMGGAVVLTAVTGPEPPDADGIVLVAPAVWARATMPWYQRVALWFSVRLFPGARVTGGDLRIQASDNIEMLRGLGRDPLFIKETRVDAVYGLTNLMDAALAAGPALRSPALLLYGERDEVVPKNPTLRLWRSLPPAARDRQAMALYENGWHMLLRDLGAETVLADIVAWTGDPQAPLPSGADRRAAEILAAGQGGGESGGASGAGGS